MCNIYGIISSNYRGTEIKSYEKKMKEYFQNNGGIVYVFSKGNKEQILNYLDKILDINIIDYHNKNRIIFLSREDFLIGDNLDKKIFNQAVKRALLDLENHGAIDKYVYITIDSYWEDLLGEDGINCYDTLEKFNSYENTNFILRYIMEELSEKYIYNLLKYHKSLLVDGMEDFEIYSPEELMYKSMTLLARHNYLIHNLEREIIRLEYFKSLGELMEGTVHDMNNLLITILGYAQLAMITEDGENLQKSLRIIQNTALDGKIIIDRLKHYIRGNASSLNSTYKFDDIVKSSIEMTEHKFNPCSLENKIELKLIVDLNSNRYIYGNEYELRQSIINIILNGVDAMGTSGTMTIKTYDSGEKTILEIEDTGHGMDETTKERLFNPYFSTKGNKGTGLGLNIARKVFYKHGAEINIESEINVGTKFLICFPTKLFMANVAETESKDYNIT